MKKSKLLLTCGLCITFLSGCQMNRQNVGTLTGGVLGGLVGSQFGSGAGKVLAIVGGTAVGALIGGKIGKEMDAQDKQRMVQALEKKPTGKIARWQNPDTGIRYQVEPTKTYTRHYRGATQPCREYTTTAIIGGKKEQVYGKACRMDGGSWKVLA